MRRVHFRLTYVAKKRICLSFLILLVVGAVSSLTNSIVGVIGLCSFYSIDYLQRVSFRIKNKSYTAKCFNPHSKFNNENEKKKYNA